MLQSLHNIQALGTDGELAHITVFKNALPNAIHLHCFEHFQYNCDSKLRALNFKDATWQEILADIHGVEDLDQRQLGLVDAADTANFDVKLAAVAERWDKLEKMGRRVLPGESANP